jgi:hypothetical protein
MCSSIHAVFSSHFELIATFFVQHAFTSIFLFSSSLSLSPHALDQLIDDFNFAKCLLRELISFHHF